MDGWKIRRAVDLQEDSPPVERLRALATLSSRQAHDFVIVVLDGDKPADLTGMQPWLSMILPGRASLQKQVGKVQANVVSVTLPKIGYAERGDVSIILSLMDKDGQTQIPLYGCVMRVMEDSTDTIIDEGNVIPSLAELLAQFDACKAAAGAANTAAGKAISAASAADVAAKAANTQASAAQNAASLAGRAATNAQNAADRIDGMTATAASLSADETPTANLVKAGDHYELELGIPQGRKGDTGATPKIKLSVVTGEPGTDARVEQSGTAENPMVEFTIPRGDTGSLGNLTINGKAPDAGGKVVLSAVDVGASSAAELSQLKGEIAKYNFGQPYNLLDNSDFVHPVAQAGVNGAHGATGYAVDRWNRTSGATVSQAADGLKIVSDKTSWTAGIQQRIEAKRFADVMTFAVRGVFPVACRLFVYIGSGTTNFGTAYFQGDAAERTLVLKLTKPDGLTGDEVVNVYISPDTGSTGTAAVIRWAALYEGEYTAETLPPYVPKGYAAELAECLRYYRRITATNETFAGYCANGVSYCMIPLQTMRIKPSLVPSGKFYYTLGDTQRTTTATATAHSANVNRAIIKCAITETGILTGTISPQGDIDISADL